HQGKRNRSYRFTEDNHSLNDPAKDTLVVVHCSIKPFMDALKLMPSICEVTPFHLSQTHLDSLGNPQERIQRCRGYLLYLPVSRFAFLSHRYPFNYVIQAKDFEAVPDRFYLSLVGQ